MAKKKTKQEVTSNLGVYDLMQSERENGKWNKKKAVLQRTTKVFHEYAENHNKNYEASGSFYVLNEKLNGEYLKGVAKKSN